MSAVGRLQILVVDDNAPMRQVVRSLLRASGMPRVAEADGALEALDLMHRFPVDLALVDWKMKPTDGLAFTRTVRTSVDSPNPYMPILMLTAYTEISRVAAARDAGVSGFVKKPISARALLERITAALMDPRPFVRTEDFFGPDRRHGELPGYRGPWRRQSDYPRRDAETVDLDDRRYRA
jgi:two-component system, chemotaxis family, chemotaxis protein CheY